MKRIALPLLLALLMLACLSGAAQAAAPGSVVLGGVELVNGNETTYYKNGDSGQPSGAANDWNAKLEWEDGKAVLTLKDLDYQGEGYLFGTSYASKWAALYANGELSLALEGSSELSQ